MRLSKLDIAIGHLEAACALYLAGHHPATVVLLAGTAEDMLRALPPANDTPTIGEHMLQVARQMSARQDLVYRDIKEDMVGLRLSPRGPQRSSGRRSAVSRPFLLRGKRSVGSSRVAQLALGKIPVWIPPTFLKVA